MPFEVLGKQRTLPFTGARIKAAKDERLIIIHLGATTLKQASMTDMDYCLVSYDPETKRYMVERQEGKGGPAKKVGSIGAGTKSITVAHHPDALVPRKKKDCVVESVTEGVIIFRAPDYMAAVTSL